MSAQGCPLVQEHRELGVTEGDARAGCHTGPQCHQQCLGLSTSQVCLLSPWHPGMPSDSMPPMGTRGSVQLGHSPALLPAARYHRRCPGLGATQSSAPLRILTRSTPPRTARWLGTTGSRYHREVPPGARCRWGCPGARHTGGRSPDQHYLGARCCRGCPGGSVPPGGAPRLSLAWRLGDQQPRPPGAHRPPSLPTRPVPSRRRGPGAWWGPALGGPGAYKGPAEEAAVPGVAAVPVDAVAEAAHRRRPEQRRPEQEPEQRRGAHGSAGGGGRRGAAGGAARRGSARPGPPRQLRANPAAPPPGNFTECC